MDLAWSAAWHISSHSPRLSGDGVGRPSLVHHARAIGCSLGLECLLQRDDRVGETVRRSSANGQLGPSRDSYQRYAVALYRQALLTSGDSALAESVFRRRHQLVAGSARQDRRPGLLGALGYIRASRVLVSLPAII
jgi:hypothetical protein